MSTIIHGYKYRIYPTEEQACQLGKFIDLSRYVYNWGIAKEREIYEQYKQGLSENSYYFYYDLVKLFNEERSKPGNEWLRRLPYETTRKALKNVDNAYQKYFKKICNHPKFKSKKKCKKSFNTRHDRFYLNHDKLKIEGIKTRIDLKFDCGLDISKVGNPVISKDNLGNYYVSFSLEEESKDLLTPKTEGIGIDLGIRRTFTLSTGEIYNQPKDSLNKLERKRNRVQRHVTRDIKSRMKEAEHTKTKYEDIPKSKRAIKRELKLNKIYKKIHNTKDTFYHTITKQIVMCNPEYICMETFSVMKNIEQNRYSAKYLTNTSFYDITCKMRDKCNTYNIPFIQAPRDFASTQICSNCGHQKNMSSHQHTYRCPVCGMVEDRDINAAINLSNYGHHIMYPNSQLLIA